MFEPCPAADDDAVALYRFDGSHADEVAGRDGREEGGSLSFAAGAPDCGSALRFPSEDGPVLVVADDPVWDMDVGSVDFWVRFDVDAAEGFVGILSRDQVNQDFPGHLTVFRLQDGSIMARIQSTTESNHQCANAPSPEGEWIHVGVNFGPPAFELWVDGERATRTGGAVLDAPGFPRFVATCGGTFAGGIGGNDLPWVLGAYAGTDPRIRYLGEASIDHLRISRVRRDFSSYAR